jgi:MOSC domain-containing protein YiiM
VTGRLSRIFLRPSARTPVKEVVRAIAVAGVGLEGDHAGGGNRQVTVLSEESWQAACDDLGEPGLNPGLRRANLVVAGLDLASAIGKVLRVGPCSIRIVAETRPCRLMDDAAPGLQSVLDPDRRGGVYGRIMTGGVLDVGAPVETVEVSEPEPAFFGGQQ